MIPVLIKTSFKRLGWFPGCDSSLLATCLDREGSPIKNQPFPRHPQVNAALHRLRLAFKNLWRPNRILPHRGWQDLTVHFSGNIHPQWLSSVGWWMVEARTGGFGRGSSKPKDSQPQGARAHSIPSLSIPPSSPSRSEHIEHRARTDASTDATTKETTNTLGSEGVEMARHSQHIYDVMVINNFQGY